MATIFSALRKVHVQQHSGKVSSDSVGRSHLLRYFTVSGGMKCLYYSAAKVEENEPNLLTLHFFFLLPFADGAAETVITFDQGAKWQRLQQPQNSLCDTETSTNRPKKVRRAHRLSGRNRWNERPSCSTFDGTCLLKNVRAVCRVSTVQTSHPRLLQHHLENERPHAATLAAQRRWSHSGTW